MVENPEDNSRYEDARKQIDTLDKSIDNLSNNNQEKIDFTQYERELQNIFNSLKNINTTIDTIVNKDIKKDLQDRFEKLKAKILTIISDIINIDNFIDGKTTDTYINNQVTEVSNQFYRELEGLYEGLDFGEIDKLLSEPLTLKSFSETLQFLGIPEGSFQISGQNYPGFISPNGEMYALVEGRLRMCELENYLKPIQGLSTTSKLEKPGESSNGEKKTVKVKEKLGSGFSAVGSMDINESPVPGPGGDSSTLRTGLEWKGGKIVVGSTSANTDISAYYSPGGFTGEKTVMHNLIDYKEDHPEWLKKYEEWIRSYDSRAKKYEDGKGNGWKSKPTYKLVFGENIKVKFISFSIKETLKTSDFLKLKFSTEIRAAYKHISAIANFCNEGLSFIGASRKLNF